MKRILLVEDRDLVRQGVSQALTERGFEVAGLTHWAEAMLRVNRCVDDAILLDGPRQRDDLLKRVGEVRQRGAHHVYVSGLVSAEDGDAVARAGASFCWFAPMTPDALAMSMRLLVNKLGGTEICVGPFVVDTRSSVLRWSDGRVLPLRPQAFTMLYELARRPGRVVSRVELSEKLSRGRDTKSNIIEVCANAIRKVLGELAWMLETVRGQGYVLRVSKV